ncbi:MAG: CHASE2 domain-containing protein [Candidatus Riflebacteria bacterium]|nr:CHASE2 domain-containing protein [Candidatus Riflebacteria bacterium]
MRSFPWLEGLTALGIALLAIAGQLTGVWEHLEARTIDWRFATRSAAPVDDRIVVVTITDDCLERLGEWPISRRRYAEAVASLASAGARLIAFDLLIDSPSATDPQGDVLLVEACQHFGRVVWPSVFRELRLYDPVTHESFAREERQMPLPSLASVAAGIGFINVDFAQINPDGIIRRNFLFHRWSDRLHPGFPLAIRQAWRAGEGLIWTGDQLSIDGNRVPFCSVPPLAHAPGAWQPSNSQAVLIDFPRPAGLGSTSFAVYPFADLLAGEVPPAAFRNRIVLIGLGAVGLGDMRLTPYGVSPGVMVHAALLRNLLDGEILAEPGWPAKAGIVLGLSLVTGVLLCLPGTLGWTTVLFLGVVGVYLAAAFLLFTFGRLVLPLAAPVVTSIVQYVVTRLMQLYKNLKRANIDLQDRNEQLSDRVRELSILNQAGETYPAMLDLGQLSRTALADLGRLSGTADLLLVFFRPEGDQVAVLARQGFEGPAHLSAALERSQLAYLNDLPGEIKRVTDPDSLGFAAFLPLSTGNREWGGICFRRAPNVGERPFSPGFWSTLAGLLGTALENARLFEMAREISSAQAVQAALLPSGPLVMGDFEVCGRSRPATQLGGDSFDYFPIDGKSGFVMIADVMGHGVPAALGMAIIKTTVAHHPRDSFAMDTLIEDINRALRQSPSQRIMATALLLHLDLPDGTVGLYHCGHVHPILRTADGQTGIHPVPSGSCGKPLGTSARMRFSRLPIPLRSGDRLILYTDGLVESLETLDRPPGTTSFSRFVGFLAGRPVLPVAEACDDILAQHPFIQAGGAQPDDFTVVIVARNGPEKGCPSPS